MKPQIVKEIRNSNGIVKSFYPEVVNRVISEDTSAAMRNILERVVADPKGTGKNAYIKGYRSAEKQVHQKRAETTASVSLPL